MVHTSGARARARAAAEDDAPQRCGAQSRTLHRAATRTPAAAVDVTRGRIGPTCRRGVGGWWGQVAERGCGYSSASWLAEDGVCPAHVCSVGMYIYARALCGLNVQAYPTSLRASGCFLLPPALPLPAFQLQVAGCSTEGTQLQGQAPVAHRSQQPTSQQPSIINKQQSTHAHLLPVPAAGSARPTTPEPQQRRQTTSPPPFPPLHGPPGKRARQAHALAAPPAGRGPQSAAARGMGSSGVGARGSPSPAAATFSTSSRARPTWLASRP